MYIFSALAACCTLAVVALLAIIARNYARYRGGRMPRQTYVRDCLSNAGIALVAAAIVLLRLGSLVAPAVAMIIWPAGLVSFCAGVVCVATGFGLLVRENRQRA
ncbi:MAG: hypothetical protein ACR2JW_21820 [Thermomicrobiales bacterium]